MWCPGCSQEVEGKCHHWMCPIAREERAMNEYTFDVEYLRDLANRLMRVPVMYGTDQGDVDRLHRLASKLESKEE